MKLGLKLLQERGRKGSFWWSYISNLPETYTLPIFFPGEDIKNLQYAPLLHQVLAYSHSCPHTCARTHIDVHVLEVKLVENSNCIA